MPIAEYASYDATGLAELVRSRAVTPLELVDTAIGLIEKHNPTLNAVVWTMFDRARNMAKAPLPQGCFAGVPFLLKDSLGDLEGAPTRHGSAGTGHTATPECHVDGPLPCGWAGAFG
jgi:amidase